MSELNNNGLSKKEQLILDNAKATLAIEGMIVTETETKIFEDYLKGILTEDDVMKIIRSKEPINKK
ncbi:antitoxin VbhA family protein [Clostridium sp.]|uniref:antitoxin VbhA family protein n=1 Tax=Clostridium sp. TaxID=1506 RepID=UPI001A3DE907|nr:antitoxin VbhA family protein [Clostridium sp.]MBK5234902.1 antitoxin VbhA family protein [Clostridium sp.]